ncbi:hypothetical protein [Thiothrix subterranea]|uniref:DUF4129 domain-containing protein n=1 Tax=Thiothrix subterranea TaxID=2735563 RepID=A0AA51MKU6_9GAMM|nr:hypothetical protein [Thiothrix subterranea]MDQ5767739.1 hypothetical protein [Thiothrix subterranea]WML85544.1 hypothetical protein RCG00_14700 [Thiothrix subterranea]
MKLDELTANIRLRSPWEAVDLGFALVQHHARWIFPAWALLLGSFALILWVLTPDAYKTWLLLVLLWCKPLYDRVLLHILSHQMFNQRLSTAAIISALPYLIRQTGLISELTWRRFSLSRGFNLSIWQLEQLRGKARAERQHLLHLQTHSHAIGLTIVCLQLQWVIVVSLYVLILLFDPTENDSVWNFMNDSQYWSDLLRFLLLTLAVLIIEPFFVAANFSLYLNRRTQLEAWDIEIAFRNLGTRLNQLSSTPLSLLLAGVMLIGLPAFTPQTAWANATTNGEYLAPERLPPEEAAAQINEVMQREELVGMRTQYQWVLRNPKEDTAEDPIEIAKSLQVLFANITKLALWIAVIALLIMAFVYREQILALLKRTRRKTPAVTPPDVLFGMDIRPESLPDDIAAASQRLWESGQQREALSLLYRGALMRLTRHDHLNVQASHTEGDILRLAQPHLNTERLAWLQATTQAWQAIAYAHRSPDTHTLIPLWQGWRTFNAVQERV